MDTMTQPRAGLRGVRINHLLPYLAVFQSEIRQTLQSWLYRVWVLLSILVAVGYILYRFGAYREAGIVQHGSELMTDLMRWLVLGSITLIIILTAGCISSERGTMADSVLSRGISRRQYFLGKWHARLVSILGTFLFLGGLILTACYFLLRDEHLSLVGCLVAMASIVALLTVVISCGVSVSAMTNSTLLGVAIVWMLLYGISFGLTFLPPSYPAPERVLHDLPNMLRGIYDLQSVHRLLTWSAGMSMLMALLGMFVFSRRDV